MLSGRPLFYLKKKEKLAGMVTRWLSLSLVVPLVVTPYHSLLLFVIRCHSLSFVVTRCTTRCHSLSFVVARCTRWSRYKSNFETHAKTRSLLFVIQFTGSHRNIFLWLPVNCITKSRLLVFAWVSKFDLYLLQRVHRATTNDNEWQRVVQRVTTNDNEWQRMTKSNNEW